MRAVTAVTNRPMSSPLRALTRLTSLSTPARRLKKSTHWLMQPRAKVSGALVLLVTNLKLAKTELAHIFMVLSVAMSLQL